MLLPSLLSKTAASTAKVASASAFLAFTASLVRLLPWLTTRSVPLSLCLSFSFTLSLAALEIVLLAAAPIGSALSCCTWTSNGSSRALATIGFSPLRQALNPAFIALFLACLCFLSSAAWASASAQPGQFLNHMLALAGSEACSRDYPADVPIVRFSVLCIDGFPRTVGSFGSPPSILWSADSALFSPHLESLRLSNIRLAVRSPKLSIQVRDASILGLLPSTPNSPNPLTRAFAFSACSFLSSLASSFVIILWGIQSRPFAFALGTLGPAAFLLSWPLVAVSPLYLPLPLLLASVLPLLLASLSTQIPKLHYRFLSRPRLHR